MSGLEKVARWKDSRKAMPLCAAELYCVRLKLARRLSMPFASSFMEMLAPSEEKTTSGVTGVSDALFGKCCTTFWDLGAGFA